MMSLALANPITLPRVHGDRMGIAALHPSYALRYHIESEIPQESQLSKQILLRFPEEAPECFALRRLTRGQPVGWVELLRNPSACCASPRPLSEIPPSLETSPAQSSG